MRRVLPAFKQQSTVQALKQVQPHVHLLYKWKRAFFSVAVPVAVYVMIVRSDCTHDLACKVCDSASFLARGVWPFFSFADYSLPKATSIDDNNGLKTSVRVRGLPLLASFPTSV